MKKTRVDGELLWLLLLLLPEKNVVRGELMGMRCKAQSADREQMS